MEDKDQKRAAEATKKQERPMTGKADTALEQADPKTLERQRNADPQQADQEAVAGTAKGRKTRKYVVAKGGIAVEKGVPAKVGDVVELTASEARHFNEFGRLRPYIEDDSDFE